MERRGLNQAVTTAYQAVAHAANVGKCPEISARAKACEERALK